MADEGQQLPLDVGGRRCSDATQGSGKLQRRHLCYVHGTHGLHRSAAVSAALPSAAGRQVSSAGVSTRWRSLCSADMGTGAHRVVVVKGPQLPLCCVHAHAHCYPGLALALEHT